MGSKKNPYLPSVKLAVSTLFLVTTGFAQSAASPELLQDLKKNLCAAPAPTSDTKPEPKASCPDCNVARTKNSLTNLAASISPTAQKLQEEELDQQELRFFRLLRLSEENPEKKLSNHKSDLEVSALEKQFVLSDAVALELKPLLKKTFGAQAFDGLDLPKIFAGLKRLQAVIDARHKAAREKLEQMPRKYQVNSPMEKAMERYAKQSKEIGKVIADGDQGKAYYLYDMYEILNRMGKFVLDDEEEARVRKEIKDMEKDHPEINSAKDGPVAEKAELRKYREETFYDGEKYDEEHRKNPDYCGLSAAEITSIASYTGMGYKGLNATLNEKPVPGEKRETYLAYRDILNRALSKLRPYKGIVTRTAYFPQAVLDQHQVGATVTYPAFTSTALTPGHRTGYDFVIHSKRGRYVGPYSPNDYENEVLFQAGTKFKVLKVDKRPEGSITFTMEEVD